MGSYGTVTEFSGLIADINAAYGVALQNWKTKGRPESLTSCPSAGGAKSGLNTFQTDKTNQQPPHDLLEYLRTPH